MVYTNLWLRTAASLQPRVASILPKSVKQFRCDQTSPSQPPTKASNLTQSFGRPFRAACCTCDMSLSSLSPLASWAVLQPPPVPNSTSSPLRLRALYTGKGIFRELSPPCVFGFAAPPSTSRSLSRMSRAMFASHMLLRILTSNFLPNTL